MAFMPLPKRPKLSKRMNIASPALSLSLAGIFRNAATTPEEEEVEKGEEESKVSSENTGGRSEEDGSADVVPKDDGAIGKGRKRKKYRHKAEQIREMEALFKESPHPDKSQRQQLSKRLGLSPRQIKFWFQNRRTQLKAVQERHENFLLNSELEKLREENQSMMEKKEKACCPNCGMASSNKDIGILTTEEQILRFEHARLKAEIKNLREMQGKIADGTASPSSVFSGHTDQNNKNCLDHYSGFSGIEKSRISEVVNHALDELMKMATVGDPLWVPSVGTGHEILNYDEYVRKFSPKFSSSGQFKQSIEASRAIGIVFMDISKLVQAFMDVNQWKEMFSWMISNAATLDVIFSEESGNRNGVVQLMFAEFQMLTPLVSTRELYFIRCCKQLCPRKWAILDVSIDKIEENIDVSLMKCRKRPSGCIIEDQENGYCKVSWVEHMECQKSITPTIYRSVINNGLAFGAQHWMATLQVQCERIVFSMATNVPSKDSNGVSTLAGRKSTLKLAQRMTSSFCHAIGAPRHRIWSRLSAKGEGKDIQFTHRKSISVPGEPSGLIICAVSSTWLPIPSMSLFDFLRQDLWRNEWNILLNGDSTRTIVNISKGQDRGNSVSIHATNSTKKVDTWILQDSCTNAYESMVVFAPVDIDGMKLVITGRDSTDMAILPSGFSILPDKHEMRPSLITSSLEERNREAGSLLTIAFQTLVDTSPTVKLTTESVEILTTLISCTMHNIKRSLQCEDG